MQDFSIVVKYLEPRRATVKMLRDYRNQQWKAEHGKERIRQIQSRMESVTATINQIPVSGGGGNHTEESLVAGIDRKTAAEQGFREAVEYMQLMGDSLSQLTGHERRLLELRYIDYLEGNGINRIMDEFHVSQREAYRRCDTALEKLTTLLFWKP